MRTVALTAACLLALTACGGSSTPSLAERDPEGYKACSLFAKALKQTDAESKMNGNLEAGEQAAKAATKSIRDAAAPMFDESAMEALEGTESEGQNFFLVDRKKITKACKAEGFDLS